MKGKFNYYEQLLKKKYEQEHYKQLRCIVPLDEFPSVSETGGVFTNFSSNDFLGLSENSHIKKNTIHYVLRWGAGSSFSRFLPEQFESQKKIEEKLSALVGFEDSILFSSDYQAHSLSLAALGTQKTQIFIDKHCKSSLFYGSYQSKSSVTRFDHNDIEHLEELLSSQKNQNPHSQIIIVESIFQYGGDYAPLDDLISLSEKHNAILYVDDSNSVGVEGKDGMGLCSHRQGIDFTVGTFGKTCGAYGAFLCCNTLIKDYLLHFDSTISSLNSLPPAALGAIDAALDLIPDMDKEREKIKTFSKSLRDLLKLSSIDLIDSKSHIICARFENEKNLKAFFHNLTKKNILTSIIKPPQHLRNGSLLSFIISALHSEKQFKLLSKSLNKEALMQHT